MTESSSNGDLLNTDQVLALSPVTTNRVMGASLRWATGSDDQ